MTAPATPLDSIRRVTLRPRHVAPAVAGFVLVALLVCGYFAPMPHNALEPDPSAVNQAPGGSHWFGTDQTGFDVFSRDIVAAKFVIPLVVSGTLVSLVIGVALGLLGSSESRLSQSVVRVMDALQAFPLLVLSITLVTLTGNHLWSVIIAIALVNVPRFMRLVRSEAIIVRKMRYVEAAISVGCSTPRVIMRHVLPNVAGTIVAQASLAGGYGIIVIASLNFLGVGVTDPDPTWGSMIQAGAHTVSQGFWWEITFPTATVLLVVICFNSLARAVGRL